MKTATDIGLFHQIASRTFCVNFFCERSERATENKKKRLGGNFKFSGCGDKQKHRQTDKQKQGQTETQTNRQTETRTNRNTDKPKQKDKQKQGQTETQTNRQTETETNRNKQKQFNYLNQPLDPELRAMAV